MSATGDWRVSVRRRWMSVVLGTAAWVTAGLLLAAFALLLLGRRSFGLEMIVVVLFGAGVGVPSAIVAVRLIQGCISPIDDAGDDAPDNAPRRDRQPIGCGSR